MVLPQDNYLPGAMEQLNRFTFGDRLAGVVFDRRLGVDLGFDLPVNWPADMACEVTLAQLTVLARKLEMRIEITNLDLLAR